MGARMDLAAEMGMVDEGTRASLVEVCQGNPWLMLGGCAWQDDPFMEEYPYEFRKAESVADLRAFFEHGNWAIRDGIVYRDLAFIQQVNGGDEWWTLKRDGEGWAAFESISLEAVARRGGGELERLVDSMHRASVARCIALDYMEGEPGGAGEGIVCRAESVRELAALLCGNAERSADDVERA